jgi:hypothetical protein
VRSTRVHLLAAALLAGAWLAGRADAAPDGGAPAASSGSPGPSEAPGFHMEGQPQLELPFSDVDGYRRTVDRFLTLHEQMRELRDDFAKAVQDVLARLGPGEGTHHTRCPEAELAAPFGRAFALGQQYLHAGHELERRFTQVRELDALGESQGLTPDYRYKVKRVLDLYKQLLGDYREMKIAFHAQVAAEVRFRGCNPDRLLALAEQTASTPPEVEADVSHGAASPPPAPAAPHGGKDADEPRTASTITFYVDNSPCREPVRVYVDQIPLGQVEGGARGAFRAKMGPHDVCTLAATDGRACGSAGTLRRAYLHDGFSLLRRCGNR